RGPALGRRRERTRVVPVVPNPSATAERAIDRLGDANGEALKTTPEEDTAVGFDEKMNVIRLNAEMQQAKPYGRRRREPRPDGREEFTPAQRGQARPGTESHMHRAAPIVG